MKTFARVYVNLELLVNENIFAYGTMIRLFAILKSCCANSCYLIQIYYLNLLLKGCICLMF